MNDGVRQDPPPVGSKLPLLFSYRETVFGNGFVAEVKAENGRVLCVHEPDGFWMYGINPGGMAAVGKNPGLAHRAFRRMFASILLDLASESADIHAFRGKVREFFEQTNTGYEPEWIDAVEHVRAGRVAAAGLRRVAAESPRSIAVESKRQEQFTVNDNRRSFEIELVAACA